MARHSCTELEELEELSVQVDAIPTPEVVLMKVSEANKQRLFQDGQKRENLKPKPEPQSRIVAGVRLEGYGIIRSPSLSPMFKRV